MEKTNEAHVFLYGTGNPAKLNGMRQWLASLGIELIGLSDLEEPLKQKLPKIEEDGKTPLENAEKKARAYYKALGIPVFSCDSGLYIDGVPEKEQPGIHVRTVNGKYLNDEEMLAHYTGLARKYGMLRARYRNAICLVQDEEHIYSAMKDDMASEPFLISAKPHADGIREPGFPLDCISIDIKTGKYYYDLAHEELEKVAVKDGFFRFFEHILKEYDETGVTHGIY